MRKNNNNGFVDFMSLSDYAAEVSTGLGDNLFNEQQRRLMSFFEKGWNPGAVIAFFSGRSQMIEYENNSYREGSGDVLRGR